MNFWIQLRYWITGFIPFWSNSIVCRPWIQYLGLAQICGQRILMFYPHTLEATKCDTYFKPVRPELSISALFLYEGYLLSMW